MNFSSTPYNTVLFPFEKIKFSNLKAEHKTESTSYFVRSVNSTKSDYCKNESVAGGTALLHYIVLYFIGSCYLWHLTPSSDRFHLLSQINLDLKSISFIHFSSRFKFMNIFSFSRMSYVLCMLCIRHFCFCRVNWDLGVRRDKILGDFVLTPRKQVATPQY